MTDYDLPLLEGIPLLVPMGMLGGGPIRAEHVRRGIAKGARGIALDAGSTDSGASFLARGVSKAARETVKRNLEVLMVEAAGAGIPLLIGSCGTAGTDSGVDWTRDIVVEVATERGLIPRIACLYSEQAPDLLKRKLADGKIVPLKPAVPLDEATIDSCDRIVALMGPEPYLRALEGGADIVLGGRSSDPAVLSAVPLHLGAAIAPTWHAAKIAECGSMCSANPGLRDGVLVTIGADAFDVEPLSAENRCTPETVSAHMLYENSNPYLLTEPGGALDVTNATYVAANPARTRVAGAGWRSAPYTMKLEGARAGPFQTIMLMGVENPEVLANVELFLERLEATLRGRVDASLALDEQAFDISLRAYGWNAVSGRPVAPGTPPPPEIGVMFVATASTQELATKIASVCNATFFHFPLEPDAALPTYAFPFGPAHTPRGQVYEFVLNHVVQVDDPLELVRTVWVDLSRPAVGGEAHG